MPQYGFLGLGIMGAPMAANLIRAGHGLTVWNRTADKCGPLVDLGAKKAATVREVVAASDITFAMLADPAAAERVVFGPDGVIDGMSAGRGYVDMSTVDESTSRNISEAVAGAGGRLFLGEVGQGARMKLVVNMIMGGMMSSFCEGLALGSKGGLSSDDILDVLASGALANPMFAGKGALIAKGDFGPAFPLKHMQKDLRLATDLGDILCQSLPSAEAAHQAFTRALTEGLGDEDFSAVFKTVTD
jgi:3-hydroxyisobutyrate dehydrogenase-like beta-hydroxyacid dehydrogenase